MARLKKQQFRIEIGKYACGVHTVCNEPGVEEIQCFHLCICEAMSDLH